jgi:YVTN family beta-propeller protein
MGRGGFNDLAITPDGKHAYVTSGKVVSVVDTSTNTVEARVPMDVGFPTWIAITPNGKQAYVGNVDLAAPPGKEQLPISVIDTTLKKVVATIPVARMRWLSLRTGKLMQPRSVLKTKTWR